MVINNYKTVICKYWEQGKCKYQQNCSFAHGDSEIRNQNTLAVIEDIETLNPLKDPKVEFVVRSQQISIITTQIL